MRNILVTGYNGRGEDVMVIGTTLTVEQLSKALTLKGQTFEEIYEVKDEDMKYYIYDPLHSDKKFEENVLKVLENN